MYLTVVIIICLICLILEGFFSGSEIAMVNADKSKIESLSKNGSTSAKLTLYLIQSPVKFFSATLVGTNLCVVTASVAITLYAIHDYGESYTAIAMLWWPVTLIFGEIVPKSLYQHYADKIILKIAPILIVWSYLIYPIIWFFGKLSVLLFKIIPEQNIEQTLSRHELEKVLENGTIIGTSDVKPDEQVMIARILSLADKRVGNIMTPLVDVKTVSITASRHETEQLLEDSNHSRIPVIKDKSYDIVGIISCNNLLFKDQSLSIESLIEPVLYVPEEMPLDELLKTLRKKSENMAVVVDEYGAAVGVVTNEDLLEEVVGDIKDEHDKHVFHYKRIGSRHYIVNGKMEIEEANARLGLEIPAGDYETVAGFVIHKMEKIPIGGEMFECGNWNYIIKKATPRAILEVEVKKK